jgi:hypothetical protein
MLMCLSSGCQLYALKRYPTLHKADLSDRRARRALLGIEVNLLERDNLRGRT